MRGGHLSYEHGVLVLCVVCKLRGFKVLLRWCDELHCVFIVRHVLIERRKRLLVLRRGALLPAGGHVDGWDGGFVSRRYGRQCVLIELPSPIRGDIDLQQQRLELHELFHVHMHDVLVIDFGAYRRNDNDAKPLDHRLRQQYEDLPYELRRGRAASVCRYIRGSCELDLSAVLRRGNLDDRRLGHVKRGRCEQQQLWFRLLHVRRIG